jgi:hypothetical protein
MVDTCAQSVKWQAHPQASRDHVSTYGQLGLRLGAVLNERLEARGFGAPWTKYNT